MDVLSGPTDNAPFAVIETADDFNLENVDTQWDNVWQIPFLLIVFFTDHDTAHNARTTLRDAVIAHLLNKDGYQTASHKLRWGLRSIRAAGPADYIYDAGKVAAAEAQGLEPPLPTFEFQRLIATVQEIQVD
jgi:hypothetical protein